MALGFAVSAALVYWTFSSSATDADAVDEEALLCAVSQAASLVWAGWSWGAVETRQLAVLPAADAQQISQHIALFLAIQFLDVAVCTHGCGERIDLATKSKFKFFDLKSHHRSIALIN